MAQGQAYFRSVLTQMQKREEFCENKKRVAFNGGLKATRSKTQLYSYWALSADCRLRNAD
jgi:hypothetical protein